MKTDDGQSWLHYLGSCRVTTMMWWGSTCCHHYIICILTDFLEANRGQGCVSVFLTYDIFLKPLQVSCFHVILCKKAIIFWMFQGDYWWMLIVLYVFYWDSNCWHTFAAGMFFVGEKIVVQVKRGLKSVLVLQFTTVHLHWKHWFVPFYLLGFKILSEVQWNTFD